MENLYADIAARTGGNIYIGVVGPVRTGKSTLIKRIMEQLVIPNIEDPYRAERARDELPQSSSGKTIMTSEPKFVPENAVEISPDGTVRFKVRMIDSVGYMVDGAVGATEDGVPRMVTTPWFDYEIPMTEAAELGTKKVMEEHCSIGIVVTTDGSVTDIPRADYMQAENRAIQDIKATGKPFLVIVNTRNPYGSEALAVKEHIHAVHGVDALIMDCQVLGADSISQLLLHLLYAFPVKALHIHLPRWLDPLPWDHPVKKSLCDMLLQKAAEITSLGSADTILAELKSWDQIQDFSMLQADLATGTVNCRVSFPEKMFYQILSSKADLTIENDAQLLSLLEELTLIKKEYSKISDALSSVKATGYGIVMPNAEEMTLEAPEVLKKNGTYGVKLKANAPSIHMIRVDIDTEINPMVGGEQQSRELISYLCGEDPEKLWESNIFGKSVYSLIREGLTAKLIRTPDDVHTKFRGALTKIINEGATGLICLIL